MGREFKQFEGRDFGQSYGRERNTEPAAPQFQGYHRRLILNSGGVRLNDAADAPSYPPGTPISFQPRPPEGTKIQDWIFPTPPYLSISVASFSTSGAIGQPQDTWANLRPDLLLNPDNSYSYFRMSYRVWGITPLCNPWRDPAFVDGWFGNEINQIPIRIHDHVPEFEISWPHLLPINLRIAGTSYGRMPINSIDPEDLDLPDPYGLWRIDRIVTWYGRYNPPSGIATPTLQHPNPLIPNNWTKEIDTTRDPIFDETRNAGNWCEPNHTLTNMLTPIAITITNPNPNDNGQSLYGNRTDIDKYLSGGGICAVLWDYAKVTNPLPFNIEHIEMTQISQVRS